jgi:hypothetical protein
MRSLTLAAVAMVVMASSVVAAPPSELEPLAFLLGEWRASGPSEAGAGTGLTIFSRELQGRVIMRRSFAELPAVSGRPGSGHVDLMIIYATAGSVRADYYDGEGRVIRYWVRSRDDNAATFISEPAANEPRFRLGYRLESGVLKGWLEIAPPSSAATFKLYRAWQSTRTGGTK